MATTTKSTNFGTQIREHMSVVCSEGGPFGKVDRVEGDSIKLTKDDHGQHHWIPMDWVTRVDQHVHVDRPGKQAMQEWSTSPPAATGSMRDMSSTATTQGMSGMQGMEGQEGGQPAR